VPPARSDRASLRAWAQSLPGTPWRHRTRLITLAGDLRAEPLAVLTGVFARRADEHLVVDLTTARGGSAPVAAELHRVAGALAAHERELVVVAPPWPAAAEATAEAAAAPAVAATVPAALARLCHQPAPHGVAVLPPPREIDLRPMRGRTLIAESLSMLRGRYGLADEDAAFALLREVSQRSNVKLRTLATALLTVRPPAGRRWFPGRMAHPAPALGFLPAGADAPANPSGALAAALAAALDCTDSDQADVQLASPVDGTLSLQHQHGFPDAFTEFFAEVGDGTSCAAAYSSRSRVVIHDVATDPVFDAGSRDAVLAAGCRAVQSTPVLGRGGSCLGVLSTHHPGRDRLPGGAVLRQLDRVVAETGDWLDWYRRTVVLDALEDLHQHAAAR